jgi:ribonuclease P protein component
MKQCRVARSLSRFTKTEIHTAFKLARCCYKIPCLSVLQAPKQALHARILIITPRAVGTAPERNKLRRQLKAIFYEQKLYEGNVDLIALFKKGASDLSFDKLKQIVMKCSLV